jgi:integrase
MMTAKRNRANGEGSIYPYKNGYAAYVWVDKPDGKRARKYVYGQTREDVHDKWIKLHGQAKQGPVPTSVPTLSRFLDYWLREVVEPHLAPLTHVTYERHVRLYIVPGLGAKRLDRLQVRDVQTWINQVGRSCQCCDQGKDLRRPASRRRCCAIGKCCKATLSPASIRSLRATIRAALTQARIEELISRNVAASLKLPPLRKRGGQAWESDEARKFLEMARSVDDPLYALWVLVLVLGLRQGEVLGLTWSDIDDDNRHLTIAWQIQRVRKRLIHRETKTESSDATLPLPDICVAALRRHRIRHDAAKKKAGEAWQDSDLVFTTRLGTPIEPRGLHRSWGIRCERAGVRTITMHDGRRTCASLLVDLDIHPRIVMQILRHAQFSITMEIYTKVSSKATLAALKRLGESLDEE